MPSPASVNAMPRRPNESRMFADVAPSAMRTPISLVRCVTAYDSTPYSPSDASKQREQRERAQQRGILRRRGQLASHDVLDGLDARDGLVPVDRPDRLPDRRNDRRRFDRRADHDPAGLVPALVRLFVHAIDRGPQFLRHAAIANFLHDADDRVPVALAAEASELESRAERRASRKVTVGERLVDDRRGRLRAAVGDVEEAAFAQARADR